MFQINKIYFPNLNGLRFIAAILVLIHHLELRRAWFGLSSMWQVFGATQYMGRLGVILFFVLSGFLITYLLLAEKEKTGTISIKKFYIRRILRIWPLYFIIVILSFFILPHIPFFQIADTERIYTHFGVYLFLYIIFLPNIVLYWFNQSIPYASQAWSIGIEEQFYLLCPILVKYIKNSYVVYSSLIICYLIIQLLILPLFAFLYPEHGYVLRIQRIWDFFNIDCMAIGGMFAICYFKKEKILKYIYAPLVKWGSFIMLCVFILCGVNIPYINFEVYSILFAVFILNLATNPKPIFNLENKVFHYLGKISYGLYMYHMIAIVIVIKVLLIYGITNIFLQGGLSILITILLSAISYELLEKHIIKKKKKYSKIISGDNALR